MIKLVGNIVVLVLLGVALGADPDTQAALRPHGLHYLGEEIGIYGILSLAAGLLIITGGIDLSMGSTIALAMVVFWKLTDAAHGGLSPEAAIPIVLLLGAGIGLIHGVLVAVTGLQPFVVTLCGLFIYRSLARWLANDSAVGFHEKYAELKNFWNLTDVFGVPIHFVALLVLLAVFGVFLHFTAYGRYFFAIGSNEKAARYCGVATTRYKILAYVLCSTLTAWFAVLSMFKHNAVAPSTTGNMHELYGIAAAVMGGCSLRGGEGSIPGILLGTTVMWVLPTFINYKGYEQSLEGTIFGLALLLAALLDEFLRRFYYRRT